MQITDVRIRKVKNEGKMKAIASITIDQEFVVHDIKVIDGENGLFIAMPSRKMSDGEFRDIAHPLVSETRAKIRDAILEHPPGRVGHTTLDVPCLAEAEAGGRLRGVTENG